MGNHSVLKVTSEITTQKCHYVEKKKPLVYSRPTDKKHGVRFFQQTGL